MTHGAKGALDLHSGIKLDFFRKRPKVQKDSGGVKKGKMFWDKIKSFFLPEMSCFEFDCVLWVCWNLTLLLARGVKVARCFDAFRCCAHQLVN